LTALNATLCADTGSGDSDSGSGGSDETDLAPAVLLQLDAAVDALQACAHLAAVLQLASKGSSDGNGSAGSSSSSGSSSAAVLKAGCLLAGAGRLALAAHMKEAARQLRGPRGHRSEGAKKALAALAHAVQAQLEAACSVMEDADGLLMGQVLESAAPQWALWLGVVAEAVALPLVGTGKRGALWLL